MGQRYRFPPPFQLGYNFFPLRLVLVNPFLPHDFFSTTTSSPLQPVSAQPRVLLVSSTTTFLSTTTRPPDNSYSQTPRPQNNLLHYTQSPLRSSSYYSDHFQLQQRTTPTTHDRVPSRVIIPPRTFVCLSLLQLHTVYQPCPLHYTQTHSVCLFHIPEQ